jgi:hypothetical protein
MLKTIFLKSLTMTNNVDSITSNKKNHVNCEKWNPYGICFGCGESLFTYKWLYNYHLWHIKI